MGSAGRNWITLYRIAVRLDKAVIPEDSKLRRPALKDKSLSQSTDTLLTNPMAFS